MDEPGNGTPARRDTVERALSVLGLRVDEARSLLEEATSRWRGDALRIGEGTRQRLHDLFRDLGVVTRDDWDELELRVAQLEHRLRLLEDDRS
jgi:polyhydroxyalkanoate synthesis regulator phasin